nr:asparagine synthase-related protein [uncultured Brevundimonas sp.]
MSADAYVVLVADDAAALEALSRKIGRRLAGAGWSRRVSHPFLAVYAPATSRLEVVAALDGHGVTIGEMFDPAGRPLSVAERGALSCHGLDVHRANDIISRFWGRYVLVRRTSGDASILRDPSGAVEAVTWRRDGVSVIAPYAPSALDGLLPDDLAIDWNGVAGLLERGGGYRHELALTGVTPVAAGALACAGQAGVRSWQIWRPAEVYRNARERPRPDLREVVDRAVQSLARERTWVAEVSGGLDSAIVAAALTDHQRARVTQWVNHFVDDPEGDERSFARPVVERHGYRLTEVKRSGLDLSAERLSQSADAFRPATNDIDTDYNDDIARRVEHSGAWGSLTGQGGDVVFYQMPTFLIAFDEIQERRLRARTEVLHAAARWTGQSIWPQTWLKARRTQALSLRGRTHPWLDALNGVPPGKVKQIIGLVNSQAFQGRAGRSRHGPCINPLLSQPVMEAGLAWSSVDLTWGGRDRFAARAAYVDAIPASIFSRRSKGELGAFYGEAVAMNLERLRTYLLEGEIAAAGLLPSGLADQMTREALVWRGGFATLITLALTEAWLRRWQARISAPRI